MFWDFQFIRIINKTKVWIFLLGPPLLKLLSWDLQLQLSVARPSGRVRTNVGTQLRCARSWLIGCAMFQKVLIGSWEVPLRFLFFSDMQQYWTELELSSECYCTVLGWSDQLKLCPSRSLLFLHLNSHPMFCLSSTELYSIEVVP